MSVIEYVLFVSKYSPMLLAKINPTRIWKKIFLFNPVKIDAEDRQVQHIFESNATSAALAPNYACHKCLTRESNQQHLCIQQEEILLLDVFALQLCTYFEH